MPGRGLPLSGGPVQFWVSALLGSEARVLEPGCRTGSTALRLADGAESYVATDISESGGLIQANARTATESA